MSDTIRTTTFADERWRPATRRFLLPVAAMMLLMHGGAGPLSAEESPTIPPTVSDVATPPASAPAPAPAPAPATVWPRRTIIEDATITVYEPQPERLDGNLLTARAAVSVATGNGAPVFGAEWMTIRLNIDREQRTANAAALTIERIQFPEGEAGDLAAVTMKAYLQRTLTPADLSFDLDDLVSTLEQDPADEAIYNIDPPRILIRAVPTELVVFDGEPRVETAGDLALVINTPAFVCIDTSGAWWVRLESGWLTAAEKNGPWTLAPAPAAVVEAATAAGLAANAVPPADALAPALIIATEPTALVVFAGEPQWTPIADTGILAADNSDSDAFIDTATGRCWLLLAGRWFSAARFSDDATWVAVPPNALPAGLAAIPVESRWRHVRTHVSGTEEARKAAVDAKVPQTAQIPRSATITVVYDGEPRFIAIPASEVEWAENSSFAVFRTPGPQYWCCDQGVWYQAPASLGPWSVATTIPHSLHRIPAENPHHNVTYVYVYDSTPDYVWTGYTSGYLHHYTYHGCPIYGSGWNWHGYYRPRYTCPRPITWGVRLVFNPWSGGWGQRTGLSHLYVGGISFGSSRHYGGWWGPSYCAPALIPRVSRHTSVTATWHASNVRPHPHERDATIYRRVPGAQLPSRPQPVTRTADGPLRVVHDPADRVFVSRDGAVIRRGRNGEVQERRDQRWIDTSSPASGAPASLPPAQRLPRVATRPAPSDERSAPRQRPERTPENRQSDPPIVRPPQPPVERPQQPRGPTNEPRPQPPVERPQQQPPRQPGEDQRPERAPENRQSDPPIVRPPQPPVERPQQPRGPTNEPRPQPPVERPQPPVERPQQQPPRRPVEDQRPERAPENRPSAPPVSRPPQPPVERPQQQPPRRPTEEPRPPRPTEKQPERQQSPPFVPSPREQPRAPRSDPPSAPPQRERSDKDSDKKRDK